LLKRYLIVALILIAGNISLATEVEQSQIETVGNQGILIKFTDANIWIDSVYEHVNDWNNFSYKAVESNYKEQLSSTSKAQLFLTTHVHRDHFHPYEMGNILKTNSNALFMATQQPIESILESYYNEIAINKQIVPIVIDQWHTPDQLLFPSVQIQIHNSAHSNEHYQWVDNNVIEIKSDSIHLLHLGDISASEEVIKLINKITNRIDYLIIPYWLLTKPELMKTIIEHKNVSIIVITHVPEEFNTKVINILATYKNDKLKFYP